MLATVYTDCQGNSLALDPPSPNIDQRDELIELGDNQASLFTQSAFPSFTMPTAILLRDVIDSDLPAFYEQQLDPVANQMAAFPARDRDAFMAHWAKIMADEANILKTILYGDQVAGNIVSWEQSGEWEVGYWLGREFWGKGIATQALSLFLEQVMRRPLYAYVAKHNLASRRVLEKCGFTRTGEEGEHLIFMLRT